MAELSPMMQQYLQIKKQHPNEILFFRLGDFYEMFFDDALTASRELELTLTGRDCGLEERAPMCGVPYHAFEGYVQKLLRKGYHVAICEQMEDPSTAKGIVKRDIVRVYTPGTVLESGMLEEGKNNYLCAIVTGKNSYAAAFCDISTGELYCCHLTGSDRHSTLLGQLSKFEPTEILVCENSLALKSELDDCAEKYGIQAVKLLGDEFSPQENEERLYSQFGQVDYPSDEVKKALVMLLRYLDYTEQRGLERLRRITPFDPNQYMGLDIHSKRNLELTQNMSRGEKRGSLLWVLDKTKTPMGKRMLRSFVERPLTDILAIQNRLDAVQELVADPILRDELRDALSQLSDIDRLISRVIYGNSSPKEVLSLGYTFSMLPRIKGLLQNVACPVLRSCFGDIGLHTQLADLINDAIDPEAPATLKDGRVIRYGYNPQVDELRDMLDNSKGVLLKMESDLKEKTGIKTMKIGYNRVFGYYIEVSKMYTNLVPDNFIRKQTLVNGERYITDELKELESKILGAGEKIVSVERELFEQVCQAIAAKADELSTTSHALAYVDTLCSFAFVAQQNNYCRPDMVPGNTIDIADGRHPVVELLQKDYPFVPNDCLLNGADNQIALITGPNMAGKSTYMRQVALICIMAQMGSFVPAASAQLCVVDAVFTRVGASDDLSTGKSTFMVEMSEVANILSHATSHSLLILDEIGRGTSTFDGMSIARAVIEYIANPKKLGAKTLFATHYHELTVLEEEFSNIKNYNIAVKKRGDDITFLRRIVRGGADRSYGIEVAKLAGVNADVVNRAKQILAQMESEAPASAAPVPKPRENAVPNLFAVTEESALKQKINSVDINTMTPIEAMNFLYELAKMAKD